MEVKVKQKSMFPTSQRSIFFRAPVYLRNDINFKGMEDP